MDDAFALGVPVRFVGAGDQFSGATGTICHRRENGRFDVLYDELPNVVEEECLPDAWEVVI
jgi:hypothetical protein